MHYALSSSLGSMSGLNTDKLALDLQFATDKTLTARRGPTPTFTRASASHASSPNGLIEFSLPLWEVRFAITRHTDEGYIPETPFGASMSNKKRVK